LFFFSSKKELPAKNVLQNQITELQSQLETVEQQFTEFRKTYALADPFTSETSIPVAIIDTATPLNNPNNNNPNNNNANATGSSSVELTPRSMSVADFGRTTPRSAAAMLRQVVELRNQLDELRRKSAEAATENIELRFQNRTFEERCTDYADRIQQLENHVVEQAIALAETASELEELQTKHKQLTSRATSKESDVKIITKQLRTARSTAESYRQSNDRLRQENERLKAQLLELLSSTESSTSASTSSSSSGGGGVLVEAACNNSSSTSASTLEALATVEQAFEDAAVGMTPRSLLLTQQPAAEPLSSVLPTGTPSVGSDLEEFAKQRRDLLLHLDALQATESNDDVHAQLEQLSNALDSLELVTSETSQEIEPATTTPNASLATSTNDDLTSGSVISRLEWLHDSSIESVSSLVVSSILSVHDSPSMELLGMIDCIACHPYHSLVKR
jgi:regulator of replication initiation timing